MLIPMFEMLYERGNGQLCYYDENYNFVESHYNRCGVRQGCVLGAFLFCLATRHVYARQGALLGPDGALYAYFDDVYLVSDPVNMSLALIATLEIYRKVGLRIGWGPCKTKLMLPLGCDPASLLLQLDSLNGGLPHIVSCFTASLEVPRYPSNDSEFISAPLESMGLSHDRLLDMAEAVAGEDPFAALRLLQVCEVRRLGDIISAVPPHWSLTLRFRGTRL